MKHSVFHKGSISCVFPSLPKVVKYPDQPLVDLLAANRSQDMPVGFYQVTTNQGTYAVL